MINIPEPSKMFRLACDVGGTFTDVVARRSDNSFIFAKVATTPADPVEGVLNGISRLAEQIGQEAEGLLAASSELVHGTTIATNVLAQGRLARVAMLTTRGFRDVLELRDGTRGDRYSLRVPFPPPLIPRDRRYEVIERMDFSGSPLIPLDEDNAREVIGQLLEGGCEAILIGLLHSHRNPAHELRLAELVSEAGWSGPIVLSHLVLPQEGEYIRFSTAAIEAGVASSLQNYLENLQQQLERRGGRKLPIYVMQSSGGLLPIAGAAGRAARFVNSGPAGGAIAAAAVAARLDSDLVAFDVGGTTTDISIVLGGRPLERLSTRTDAHLIGLPTIDIKVLSLGGGSIASVGADGVLKLGPESAGAVPGPAAYGRGGERATLTDAAVVMGLLSTVAKEGLPLSRELAATAISQGVAEPLGLSTEAAAEAVFTLAATIVAAGVRSATIGQGIDPRGLALMGFGGGGGLLLGAVARELGVNVAIAPAAASVMSAAGFLDADMRLDTMRHIGLAVPNIPDTHLATLAGEMAAELEHTRRSFSGTEKSVLSSWIAECRYARQTGTLPISVARDELAGGKLGQIVARFQSQYATLFGHVHDGEECVIDTLRLIMTQPRTSEAGAVSQTISSERPSGVPMRRVYQGGEWNNWSVFSATELREGTVVEGPLLCHIGGSVVVVQSCEELLVGDQQLLHLRGKECAK